MAKSINSILVVLAAVLLVPATSYAAGLGTITVRSALGQPLDAEIEVVAVQPGEDFQVRLASREAYSAAGVDLSPVLQGARFTIEQRDGKTLIRVRTSQPVNDPFFSVLVELQSRTGKLARQYTVLVDPAEYKTASTPAPQQAAAAPAPVASPAPAAAPSRAQSQSPKAAAAKAPTPAPAPVVAAPVAPVAPTPVVAAPPAPVVAAPAAASVAPAPVVVATPAPAPTPVVAAAPAPVAAAPAPAPVAPAPVVVVTPAPAPTPVVAAAPAPVAAAPAPVQQRAEASGTYQIRRGDTLGVIARKWMPEGVTYEQMLVGLYHTNRSVFIRDNINLIRAGATIFIPGREDVLLISSTDAASQVRTHMAAFTKYRDSTANAGTGSARISQAQRETISSRRVGVKKSTRAM